MWWQWFIKKNIIKREILLKRTKKHSGVEIIITKMKKISRGSQYEIWDGRRKKISELEYWPIEDYPICREKNEEKWTELQRTVGYH